jgi:hypothetical protein
MAKVAIGSNAIFSGSGQSLNYIADRCYAYSGIGALDSPFTALLFNTGKEYIVGRFEFNADFTGGGGAALMVEIYFNDVKIVKERDISNNWLAGNNEYPLIIPPLTKVEVKLTGGAQDANMNFTGRSYS